MKSGIQRLYYSITEVSKILGEEQHVLRYWEREFPQLRPQKNRAGNRVYAEKDLDVLRVIKRLLREERYTVAGAKEHLRQHGVQREIERERMTSPDGHESEAPSTKAASGASQAKDAKALSDEIRSIAEDLRRRVAT
jgi:DNA-binding transcriptional MerR regulator